MLSWFDTNVQGSRTSSPLHMREHLPVQVQVFQNEQAPKPLYSVSCAQKPKSPETPVFIVLGTKNQTDTPVFSVMCTKNQTDTPVFSVLCTKTQTDTPVFSVLCTKTQKPWNPCIQCPVHKNPKALKPLYSVSCAQKTKSPETPVFSVLCTKNPNRHPCIQCPVYKKNRYPCIQCPVHKSPNRYPCIQCLVHKSPNRYPCIQCPVHKSPNRYPCIQCPVHKSPNRNPCIQCPVHKKPNRHPCIQCPVHKNPNRFLTLAAHGVWLSGQPQNYPTCTLFSSHSCFRFLFSVEVDRQTKWGSISPYPRWGRWRPWRKSCWGAGRCTG